MEFVKKRNLWITIKDKFMTQSTLKSAYDPNITKARGSHYMGLAWNTLDYRSSRKIGHLKVFYQIDIFY